LTCHDCIGIGNEINHIEGSVPMPRFRPGHRHQQCGDKRSSLSSSQGSDRVRRAVGKARRVPVTLGLAMAIVAVPSASLGGTVPAASTSVGATTVDLEKEHASQAAVVRAALEVMARRLARERHEAWVAQQLAKRAAAYAALIASNRARYGATPDWDATASCESNGRWDINSGNGYWGGLQFSHGTWFGNGGGPFDGTGPFPFTKAEQIVVAEHVLAGQGPHAWPICFRWK
jgi:hypothetical protein